MRRIISTLIVIIFLLILTPMALGASWSAYVFDADSGLGIDAVNVTAILNIGGTFVNSTLTNASGFFNISITNSVSVQLVSSKSTYLTDTSQSLPPITDDRVLPFNITLTKLLPGNIIGRVTDNQSSGIVNTLVAVIQGSSIIDSALTNSSGDYAIINLTDGTYTIQVSAAGYVTQNTTNVVVQPNSTTELNFTLALADVSVSTVPSAQASQPAQAAPEKRGGSPCPPGTSLVGGKCVTTKKPKQVPEEEPVAEEIPEVEELAEEPVEEQLQPPAITGAAVVETRVVPLGAQVLLVSILVFVLLLFLMNPSFRIMIYKKLKTYSKKIKKLREGLKSIKEKVQ